ncbi:MAG: polysaccharide deacetylase family protein [Leptospirales bacterium]|nr:polysaccharide deacetylase family protein [Leptospirales bacterium]
MIETEQANTKDGVFVLCYHAFTNSPNEITFPIRQLDLHMKTLKDGGFNFITTEDLIAKRYRGLNNVLITSDDGNRSVYWAYKEVFKKYNIKPLIGIYPAIISREHYALTWEQITELHREGCYIAPHGYFHLFLDAEAYKNDPKASRKEVVDSKRELESKLGFDMDIFVYPYGKRCPEIVQLVEEIGYKFAFTIDHGIIYRDDLINNRFELPRYMIMNSNVNQIFELMFKSINKPYEPNPELVGFSREQIRRAR